VTSSWCFILQINSSVQAFRLVNVQVFTVSPMCATCPVPLIRHDVSLMIQDIHIKAEAAHTCISA